MMLMDMQGTTGTIRTGVGLRESGCLGEKSAETWRNGKIGGP